MEPRLSLVTLGVADIARSRKFYEKMGWKASSASNADVVFFQSVGMILALFGRIDLAADAGVRPEGSGFAGIALLSFFSDALARTVQIAFFLPIILGMGGNVGNQCSTVIVRGIATGRLDVRALPRILMHEAFTSLVLASTFAIGLAGFAALTGLGPPLFPLAVALGIFCSIMIGAAGRGRLLPSSVCGRAPAPLSHPLNALPTSSIRRSWLTFPAAATTRLL